jgi:hypothetical protein
MFTALTGEAEQQCPANKYMTVNRWVWPLTMRVNRTKSSR